MKTFLRSAGLLVAMTAAAVWLARGAHRGWTRTSVEVRTLDEITGIEGITNEQRFVPGIDFLGAGLGTGIALLFLSRFAGRPRPDVRH